MFSCDAVVSFKSEKDKCRVSAATTRSEGDGSLEASESGSCEGVLTSPEAGVELMPWGSLPPPADNLGSGSSASLQGSR